MAFPMSYVALLISRFLEGFCRLGRVNVAGALLQVLNCLIAYFCNCFYSFTFTFIVPVAYLAICFALLVSGIGNSGGEIAVEMAAVADNVSIMSSLSQHLSPLLHPKAEY